MLIENSFTVAAPIDFVWNFLLDVERIAPCMPGAELTEVVDTTNWKGKLNMKFGPVALAFAGTVSMESRDDPGHRVVLAAKGTEARGKGAATAKVTSWLEPGEGETTIRMEADITLSGAAAQLSRGLLPEISKKLTQQFADCLQSSMSEAGSMTEQGVGSAPSPAGGARDDPVGTPERAPTAKPLVPAKPVGGIGLGLSAIWALIAGFFKRLFGGGKSS